MAAVLPARDPRTEFLVGLAATRLQLFGGPLGDRPVAEERARNMLGAIELGEPGDVVGDEMLDELVGRPEYRRALGRRVEELVCAERDGWTDAELEQLARGGSRYRRARPVRTEQRTTCLLLGCEGAVVDAGLCATHRAR